MAATTGPDYAGVEDSIKQGFNAQRQKAASVEAGNLQGQKDALARRAAALGNAPGGAFVKAEQQAGNESAQRSQQANATIDDAQNAEMRGLKMTQLGQQYTTSEREAGQTFQAGQQDKSIDAQKAMQQVGITAQSSLQDREIAAQKMMQQTGIDAQSSLQDRSIAAQKLMQVTGIDAQKAMQLAGFTEADKQQAAGIQAQKDLQASQNEFQKPFMEAQITGKYGGVDTLAQKQFDEQTGVDQFNEKIAQQMADKKDMLEKFFGNFSMGSIFGQGGLGGAGDTIGTGASNFFGSIFG